MDFTALVVGPEGYEIEVAVRNVSWDGWDAVATRTKTFEAAMKKAGFKPATRAPTVSVAAAAGAASRPSAAYGGTVHTECPKCGGPVYDNRAKKESGAMKPNAPWFKCQDQECNWAEWPGRKKGAA